MKKLLSIFAALCLIALSIVACSKQDEKNNNDSSDNAITTDFLVGNWQPIEFEIDGLKISNNPSYQKQWNCLRQTVYTFTKTQLSIAASQFDVDNDRCVRNIGAFTYSINKNKLILVDTEGRTVVDIAKVWPEDVIYGKARMNKINIVEIDASHPYDEKMTTIFFSDYSNGKVNPYIWMGSKNLVRMVNIIGRDLIRLYPKNKAKIEKNITKFTADLLKIENEANEKLLSVGNAEVISLSENLQYFLNDMNIYTEYVDYDSVTAENVAKLIKDKGIKVIVSDRWLKKNVIKALKDAGGEFVIINTLDIPMDKDGKMDPEAILKGFKENTDNLIEALAK